MRVLAIVALAMLLAGCNGDRMKPDSNTRQAQPQRWWPLHTHDAQWAAAIPAPLLAILQTAGRAAVTAHDHHQAQSHCADR